MGQVNQPTNLIDRLLNLERLVAEIRKVPGMVSAVIKRGGLKLLENSFLEMISVGGVSVLYAGPDGGGRQVFEIHRDNGRWVMRTYTLPGGNQFWALHDNQDNIIVSDDAFSGQGLARPYIPWSIVHTADLLAHPANRQTTSGTFVPVETCYGEKQHPRLRVLTYTRSDPGTTGEVRVRDPNSGVVISGPHTIGPADNTIRFLDGPVSGAFSSVLNIDVEIRRTGGTGVVSAMALLAEGIQS